MEVGQEDVTIHVDTGQETDSPNTDLAVETNVPPVSAAPQVPAATEETVGTPPMHHIGGQTETGTP